MTVDQIELFGRALPLAPSLSVRRPCVACGLAYARGRDALHHLCPLCAEDPARTEAHARAAIAAIDRQLDALSQAEADRVAALPEAVNDRWARAMHAYDAATRAADVARVRRWPEATPLPTMAAHAERAQASLQAVVAKISRTEATVPELAPCIAAWRAYTQERGRLQNERTRWWSVLDHLDIATGKVPF